jgi:hypothetical protein
MILSCALSIDLVGKSPFPTVFTHGQRRPYVCLQFLGSQLRARWAEHFSGLASDFRRAAQPEQRNSDAM